MRKSLISHFGVWLLGISARVLAQRSASRTRPLPFVSPIFGDNMVLQRGKPNAIWGWSQPGDTCGWRSARTSATATAGADGRWQVKIRASRARAGLTPSRSPAANRRAARCAGRRRVALRRPVEHAVRPAAGQERRRGDEERPTIPRSASSPSASAWPIRHADFRAGTWKSCRRHLGEPRRRDLGGRLLLRAQGAQEIRARAHRPDSGCRGRSSGGDAWTSPEPCVR